MRWRWRLVWLGLLLLLWLICSGTALAGTLSDRLAQFPDWQGKPAVQPAQGDLVYPEWFSGEWTVTTTLVDLAAPLAPEVVTPGFESNRSLLQQPIEFKVRFVEAQPQGWQAGLSLVSDRSKRSKPIVSDRAFNGLSLAKAYLGDRAVQAVKVDPENPNRQITLLKGNRQLVSTVTDRATEALDSDQFLTSEIFQQEFRGAPQIYFNTVENTTAYQQQRSGSPQSPQSRNSPQIIADQITAVYLSPQDPNYFKTIAPNHAPTDPRPVALYRYRMEFRR